MTLNRRSFLFGSAMVTAGTALTACSGSRTAVSPSDPAVAQAEEKRGSGPLREVSLVAGPATFDLGGRTVSTFAYDKAGPTNPIRVTEGDRLKLTLANKLPEETTAHWHGLTLRNDMDGVPHLTQHPIMSGESFTYDFAVPNAGTHWFHPHHGLQLDHGLYSPLIVEAKDEKGAYDDEWVIVLDDWTDGMGKTPEQILEELKSNSHMHNHMHGGGISQWGGDHTYPAHLINGRLPEAPHTFAGKPGQRIRLRIINAGSDTAYHFWIDGTAMSITHTDGNPVTPVQATSLIIGMGERYDALITVPEGTTAINALPAGKPGAARALIRAGSGTPAPIPAVGPTDVLEYSQLASTVPAPGQPTRELDVVLSGGMMGYTWFINGKQYPDHEPLDVEQGETVRLNFTNKSMMWHPMHLHGHSFHLTGSAGSALKDTVAVLPMKKVSVDFLADNPGQWMVHCHNTYHAEAGMMTVLSYVS